MSATTSTIRVDDGNGWKVICDKKSVSKIFIQCDGTKAQVDVKESNGGQFATKYNSSMKQMEIESAKDNSSNDIQLIRLNDGTKWGFIYDKKASNVVFQCDGTKAQVDVKESNGGQFATVHNGTIKKMEIEYQFGPPFTGGNLKEKIVVYPEPKTKNEKALGMKYDINIAKNNRARNPNIKLPLLLEKKDKYGENYTDIPKLVTELGLKVENIKDYKFENQKTKPKENNNNGGESKRFDMQQIEYPQFEYSIKLKNESDDDGEEVSCKHWGPHSDDNPNYADTFIIQVSNPGDQARTQLECSHMDKSEKGIYNYGGKFNAVDLDTPKLMGNTFSIRFIRLANIPTKEIIGIVAIKYHGNVEEKWKEWNVIYETHVFDGQGGNPGFGSFTKDPEKGGRALKDPFRPWVVSALGKKDLAQVTVRMDSQPKTKIKEGEHYDNARITEIVDYELA